MSIEVLFYTQIVSIISFIIGLFTLYRLLVSQKDATIETMKENISLLKERIAQLENDLEKAKDTAPDVLAERYAKRVELLSSELSRLSLDQDTNEQVLQQKKAELSRAEKELADLKNQIDEAQELLKDYLCPYCKASMVSKEYHTEIQDYMGKGYDIDHEFIAYECGLEINDGKETRECLNKGKKINRPHKYT